MTLAIPFIASSKPIREGVKIVDATDDAADTLKKVHHIISTTSNAEYLGPALSLAKRFDDVDDFIKFVAEYAKYADDIFEAGLTAEETAKTLKSLKKAGLLESLSDMGNYFSKLACVEVIQK